MYVYISKKVTIIIGGKIMTEKQKVIKIRDKGTCTELDFDCPECPLDSMGCNTPSDGRRLAKKWLIVYKGINDDKYIN